MGTAIVYVLLALCVVGGVWFWISAISSITQGVKLEAEKRKNAAGTNSGEPDRSAM